MAPCALASDSIPTLVYLALMARESCPTSSITTLSGTPAFLRIETALCRKEWKLISIPWRLEPRPLPVLLRERGWRKPAWIISSMKWFDNWIVRPL
jgi:hypothetical protein